MIATEVVNALTHGSRGHEMEETRSNTLQLSQNTGVLVERNGFSACPKRAAFRLYVMCQVNPDNADGGLLDIWRREFGAAGSPKFEEARRNFIISEAG